MPISSLTERKDPFCAPRLFKLAYTNHVRVMSEPQGPECILCSRVQGLPDIPRAITLLGRKPFLYLWPGPRFMDYSAQTFKGCCEQRIEKRDQESKVFSEDEVGSIANDWGPSVHLSLRFVTREMN